jgi:hypothetical protein
MDRRPGKNGSFIDRGQNDLDPEGGWRLSRADESGGKGKRTRHGESFVGFYPLCSGYQDGGIGLPNFLGRIRVQVLRDQRGLLW